MAPPPSSTLLSRGALVFLPLVVLAIGLPSYFAWQIQHAGSSSFWLLIMVPTLLVAALAALRAQRDGELRDWIHPRWGDATVGVLSGVVLVAVAYFFTRIVAPPGSPRIAWLVRLYLQVGDPVELRQHAGLMAVTIIAAAASEELIWRGLVASLIAEHWGSRHAWIGSALLYALSDVPAAFSLSDAAAGPNWLLPLAALGAGLFWGMVVRIKRGSLVAAVISHAFFDWCIIMMFRLWGGGV